MIPDLISTVIGYLVTAAFLLYLVLYFLHRGWFDAYLELLARAVIGPFYLLWVLFRITARALLKSAIIVTVSILVITLYLVTIVIPAAGGGMVRLNRWINQHIDVSQIPSTAERVRVTMVEIIAEHDERSLKFDSGAEYVNEIQEVKERAIVRLDVGETLLSLLLGATILYTTMTGIDLFQSRIYGISVANLLELYLIILAVSILYRVGIVDLLSFTGEERLDSLSEWDAALSYQKGVSRIHFVQMLTLILTFGVIATRADFETVEAVLERKYAEDLSMTEWIGFAWHLLRSDDRP